MIVYCSAARCVLHHCTTLLSTHFLHRMSGEKSWGTTYVRTRQRGIGKNAIKHRSFFLPFPLPPTPSQSFCTLYVWFLIRLRCFYLRRTISIRYKISKPSIYTHRTYTCTSGKRLLACKKYAPTNGIMRCT